jgi:hypothetical protein
MEEEEEEDEGNEQVDVEWREYVEMMNSKEEEKKNRERTYIFTHTMIERKRIVHQQINQNRER